MRNRTAIVTITATTALLALLTACEPGSTSSKPAASAPTAPDDGAAKPTSATAPSTRQADESAVLPNVVGKGLQSAQDEAQSAGFYALASHDALGRGRMQAFDRNWKVCSQKPAPGTHPTDTRIDFGTVKLEENCPARDEGEQPEAKGTMPNLVGKSVRVARKALPSNTSITTKDVSGQDRHILVESNWQVCSVSPAAGAKLDGQPVTISAVKFDEDC
ncbi:hypothetical protein ACFU5O_21005 [Streptomyces sp. NPDC057445]|uniref:hypothetical protein n=1 Tax=Streptomyces sp. NPDC057445 TaxID=3346136 RepID=UPI00369D9FEC